MNHLHVARLLVLSIPIACGQVLGIEEAYVDPSLIESDAGSQTTHDHSSSSGGAPSGTQASPEAGAGGDGVPRSLCDQYCETIGEFCTGDQLQYRDLDQCLAVCRLFPEGSLEDPDSNTAICRTKYAAKARYAGGTELGAYCRQAGPGGDGRCGSNCDGYCSIMMGTCSPSTADSYFTDLEACQKTCGGLPQVPYSYGQTADSNTVQCRLFHVTSALMADTDEHCDHAMGLTLCEAQ